MASAAACYQFALLIITNKTKKFKHNHYNVEEFGKPERFPHNNIICIFVKNLTIKW